MSWVSIKLNDIERALRNLKKKMQREGVFRELKRRRFYLKPSERKTLKMEEAQRRRRNRRMGG